MPDKIAQILTQNRQTSRLLPISRPKAQLARTLLLKKNRSLLDQYFQLFCEQKDLLADNKIISKLLIKNLSKEQFVQLFAALDKNQSPSPHYYSLIVPDVIRRSIEEGNCSAPMIIAFMDYYKNHRIYPYVVDCILGLDMKRADKSSAYNPNHLDTATRLRLYQIARNNEFYPSPEETTAAQAHLLQQSPGFRQYLKSQNANFINLTNIDLITLDKLLQKYLKIQTPGIV